jgi:hypothetical protein
VRKLAASHPAEPVPHGLGLLPSIAVVNQPPGDLQLTTVAGESRTLSEWVTNFHLVLFTVDPYTNESSWLLPTMTRIMEVFSGADCRVAFLSTSDSADAKAFLGPLADRFLTYADPDRAVIKALGLDQLPAVVHISTDLTVQGAAQGWHAGEWRAVCNRLTTQMSWGKVLLPDRGDPVPFAGSPALS